MTRSLPAALLLALSTVLLATAAPPAARAAASPDSMCRKAFPNGSSKTTKIRLGTKTVYNRHLSRELVCAGDFGMPDSVRPTMAASCDLAMAIAGLVYPAGSLYETWGCAGVSIQEKGWAGGSVDTAAGALCGYLAEALGVGVGVLSAGASANPVVGVAVWKGVTFVGDTVVCIGIGNIRKDALSWGEKLEADHEVNVARDIVTRGKCLQQTKRRVVGIKWSAVTCPKGTKGSGARVARFRGTTSQGTPVTAELTADGQGLKLRGEQIYTCSGWNPYGIYKLDFLYDKQRPAVQIDRTFAYNRTWANITNTALFPWTFDQTQVVSGSIDPTGRKLSGQITDVIADHRPDRFAGPNDAEEWEVPAPGYGDPTVCSSVVTFSATR
jgi:hypothetical protein